MKEKINKFKEKMKNIGNNIKEKLNKISFMKKLMDAAKTHRFVLSMVFFCVTVLALILGATLGMKEFVVQVCVLMIIETLMAVLLHRTELWVHGILLVAQIVAGVVINRLPLVILCMVAYIAATITLQFAFEKKVEDKKIEEKNE